MVHDKFIKGEKLTFEHEEFGWVNYNLLGNALRVGELVMFKRNDYQKNLRNGSIGKVISKKNLVTGLSLIFQEML